VDILGEAIHHREDYELARHLGQPLDEVHGDVGPHLGRHLKGLQEATQLLRQCLVLLARGAGAHPVLDERTIMWNVEVCAQSVEGLLDTLMTRRVRQCQHLVAQVIVVRHEDVCAVQEQPVDEATWRSQYALLQLLEVVLSVRCSSWRPPDVVQQGECRAQDGPCRHSRVLHGSLRVAAGQGVSESRLEGVNRRNLKIINLSTHYKPGLALEMNSSPKERENKSTKK
jgi:hypothetical protein